MLFRIQILPQSLSGTYGLSLPHCLVGNHMLSTPWSVLDREEGLSGSFTYCISHILEIIVYKAEVLLPYSLPEGFSHSF